MKKSMLIIVGAFLCLAAGTQTIKAENNGPSSTQESQSSPSGKSAILNDSDMPAHFSSISFSYHPMTLKGGGTFSNGQTVWSASVDTKLNGISLFYTNANKIIRQPLYIQYGIGVQYSFRTTNTNGITDNVNFLSFKIPVEVLYRFNLGKGFGAAPFFGFDALIYALGKENLKHDKGEEEYKIDVFKGTEQTGGIHYRRFNLDWHIGARLFYKNIFLSFAFEGFELPFGLYDSKIGIQQGNIAIGFTF